MCLFELCFSEGICPVVELLGTMVVLFIFYETSILIYTVAVPICIPTHSVGGFLVSTPSPACVVCRFFDHGHSGWCELIIVLISISLIISNVDHFFMRLLAIFISLWKNIYLGLLPILIRLFGVFLVLSSMSCLYILEINSSSAASSANIFFHSNGCLFILFMVSFAIQKLLSLIRSQLFIFVFIFIMLGAGSKKIVLQFMSKSVFLMFPLRDL